MINKEKNNKQTEKDERKNGFMGKESNEEQPKKSTENGKQKNEEQDVTKSPEYKKLEEELLLTKNAVKESMEMVKNFKQDVDRIKQRNENIKQELNEKITIDIAKKLLPVLDNFDKSFAHIKDEADLKGFKMIYSSLENVLSNIKVHKILNLGVFDPNKMEAITTEQTNNEDLVGTVATVFQEGYYYQPTDAVIRVATVSVYSK